LFTLAVSRYRDRYVVSRAKSDPGDTLVLATILRTGPAAHRPLPGDSELAASIRVLARAQQDGCGCRESQGSDEAFRYGVRPRCPDRAADDADVGASEYGVEGGGTRCRPSRR
jgi:hypothetical protein